MMLSFLQVFAFGAGMTFIILGNRQPYMFMDPIVMVIGGCLIRWSFM